MATVLDLVKHYQHAIEKYPNDEHKILKCIDKLFHLDVTVQHLQDTGVGRTVNALRKEPGDVGHAARALVYKWKLMVAAEEDDQDGDHTNDTSAYNGHDNGKDSDDNLKHQSRSRTDHNEKATPNIKTEPKEVNGNYSGSKRKYQSSEDEEPNNKKSKNSGYNSHEDYKKKPVKQIKKEHSESGDDSADSDHSQSDASDSEMSESTEEEKYTKHEAKQELTETCRSSSSSKYSSHKSSENSNRESSSSKKSHDSEKHSKKHQPPETTNRHSSDKHSSKEKSHSSHKHKSTKEKDKIEKSSNYDKHSSEKDKKQKEDYKTSSSSSSKHKSDSDKHKSLKTDNNLEKHHTEKQSSKSEKHKSSSHSQKPDKEKHKGSSEKEISDEKHKSKHSSSSKEKHSSSSKDKSKERSSSSKEKFDSSVKEQNSHKSEKKSSSSSESKSKHSDTKHKADKRDEGSSETKSKHKSSSSSSHKSKSSSSKSKDEVPKKTNQASNSADSDDGIDCGSGASFAEALGMISPAKPKKKTAPTKDSPISNDLSPASLLAPSAKLAPLPALPAIEISALPEISPNYKPRPPPKLLPHFTDEDAMNMTMSSKNQRTKVYSGNKVIGKITSLYEMCVQVLQEHIDALEYTGGVPYDILKPVVDRATPQQLFVLEHYNPYLMEDTDHLWQKFCEKNFRNKQRQEMETWREMYMRCQEEQEHRLKSLTANIRIAQEAKKAPIKQTKMAYVDSVVKPPRNIARKQAQHGTAHAAAASPAARVASLAAAPNVLRGNARPTPTITPASSFKPKKAPLMQKALQFMRGRKR